MRTVALAVALFLTAPSLAAARPPVVVELFTAQGCESCVKAGGFVNDLAERPDVLPLTYSVDYWDYLGWADTFAEKAFADRQKSYVARFALNEPYTPQVVVDGRAQTAGVQTERVERLLRDAARAPRDPPDMAFIGDRRVDVGFGRAPKDGAEVWAVRFDPREQEVEVTKGDNRGQTLVQRNVVRAVARLGAWRGRPTAYRLPPDADGLKTVILVQERRGGRILGAALRP